MNLWLFFKQNEIKLVPKYHELYCKWTYIPSVQFQNLGSRNFMKVLFGCFKTYLTHIVWKNLMSTPMGTFLFCRLKLFLFQNIVNHGDLRYFGTEIFFYSKTSYLPQNMFFFECRMIIDLRINITYFVNDYCNRYHINQFMGP